MKSVKTFNKNGLSIKMNKVTNISTDYHDYSYISDAEKYCFFSDVRNLRV